MLFHLSFLKGSLSQKIYTFLPFLLIDFDEVILLFALMTGGKQKQTHQLELSFNLLNLVGLFCFMLFKLIKGIGPFFRPCPSWPYLNFPMAILDYLL